MRPWKSALVLLGLGACTDVTPPVHAEEAAPRAAAATAWPAATSPASGGTGTAPRPWPTRKDSVGAAGDSSEVPVPGSVAPLTVLLQVRRFEATGSRTLVVSNGIPLPAGALRPGDVGAVSVAVRGVEVPAFVRPLAGRHRDGSVRALLVQFTQDFGVETSLPAELRVGQVPRVRGTGAAPAAQAVPAAAALPMSADYLVGTGIVGETQSASRTTMQGGALAQYDAAFRQWADFHWNRSGSAWEENYYDRALIYFAMWARTANPEYFRRGLLHARDYRRDYLEANRYGASPHWAQLEGLQKHYLLTGDEASRYAVANLAENFWGLVQGGVRQWDQRINARALSAQLLAWEIEGAASFPARKAPASYAARMDQQVGHLLEWQRGDGSFDTGAYWCGAQANFMVGLLNDALVRVHESYREDPRIVTLVRRADEYLWNTQWVPSAQGFQYLNRPCRAEIGGTAPAPDLNGLIVGSFSWVAQRTGDARLRAAGEQLFAATVARAYLTGSKQFNEAYASSWRYLAWR